MFSSIRFRLWVSYVLIIFVVISIAGGAVLVYLIRNPVETRRETQRLRLVSKLIQDRINFNLITNKEVTPHQIEENIKRTDRTLNTRIVVFDPQGVIVLDSRESFSSNLPSFESIQQNSLKTLPRFRTQNGTVWLFNLTRINGGYFLMVTSPIPKVRVLNVFRDEFIVPFGRGILVGIILSLLFAIWISRWVSKPLQEMVRSAKSIAAREFHEVPLEGPTEVKELAIALNEMNDQIQAGERSQRDFIANVSHDLKTPLTSIQGFSQAILDGTINSKDELMHAAKVINDESTRMHSMVMDILELAKLDSKVEKYYEEDIDLVVILERIIEDLSNEAKRKSILIRKEFNTLPVIKGDSDRLFLALYNLVDNAIKYSRENGEVIIRANSANNILKISIFDSGPGIPDDELERVFERFYQTDKSRQGGKTRGVGLGLTITKEIISIHHGDAYAMNRKDLKGEENNLGSVFVIELPIHHSDDK